MDTHVAMELLAAPASDAVWSRMLALGDGIERMPVPEPWSARPVDFMATAMSIEAAVARMDEAGDNLGA